MHLMTHKNTLKWFSKEYYDLNGSHVEILESPPTSLEFSQLARISRPAVIKGFEVPALTLWSNEYLIDKLDGQSIPVAVTPNGFADAVTQGRDNEFYFAEPHVQSMTMAEFLSSLTTAEGMGSSEIHYLQSQNGNVYSSCFFQDSPLEDPSDFASLRPDIPPEVPWCSEAFGRFPDAVNLWIGDSRSVTSIHSDPYENIYTVIRGAKHFTLLSPAEGWCLQERMYPHATYTRSSLAESELILTPSPSSVPPIRWSSIMQPHIHGVLPPDAHPIHITIKAGETLYLPPGWWHHVRQDDITIALNWWYDMEMRGTSWVLLSFLRGIGDALPGNVDDDIDEDSSRSVQVGHEGFQNLKRRQPFE